MPEVLSFCEQKAREIISKLDLNTKTAYYIYEPRDYGGALFFPVCFLDMDQLLELEVILQSFTVDENFEIAKTCSVSTEFVSLNPVRVPHYIDLSRGTDKELLAWQLSYRCMYYTMLSLIPLPEVPGHMNKQW